MDHFRCLILSRDRFFVDVIALGFCERKFGMHDYECYDRKPHFGDINRTTDQRLYALHLLII
jgi:hypothetical protein